MLTRPGGVAEDGTDRNDLYTEQLLRHIDTPGLQVEQMLKLVAVDALQKTNGKQEPWIKGSLRGEFHFQFGLIIAESRAIPRAATEKYAEQAWQRINQVNSLASFRASIKEFPDSPWVSLACIEVSLLGDQDGKTELAEAEISGANSTSSLAPKGTATDLRANPKVQNAQPGAPEEISNAGQPIDVIRPKIDTRR